MDPPPADPTPPASANPAPANPAPANPAPANPAPANPAPANPAPAGARSELQLFAGRALFAGGALTLPLGLGAAGGYWLADWGVRWMPTLLGGMLLLWIAALLLMIGGSYLLGPAAGRPKGRKRIVLCSLLIVLAAGGRIAVSSLSRPSPLTVLSVPEFQQAFLEDSRQLRELERGLNRALAQLGSQAALQAGVTPRVLDGAEELAVLDAWEHYVHSAFALDHIRRFHEDYLRFDISRAERDRHLRSYLLTFTAELILYARTLELVELLERNANVVTFLNAARPERRLPPDSVTLVREELVGLSDLSRVVAGKHYLRFLEHAHGAFREARANGYAWLWPLAQAQLASIETQRAKLPSLAVLADVAPLARSLRRASYPVQSSVCSWIADVRVRRPGRYLISQAQLETLRTETLQPGDVLLGRKNWYLSNVGLPGFWPHAWLYVGSAEQLGAAFDDDPQTRAWVERESGRPLSFTEYLRVTHPRAWYEREARPSEPLLTIEAISEGVLQNSLPHSAGDYLGALRPRVPAWIKARAIARAFAYLGRPYDFDFDFATDTTLVCSEVVWRCYRPLGDEPGLRMPTVRVAGRETLPPTEFARLFRDELGRPDAQLEFVCFLEGIEQEQRARVADQAAFLGTPERSKWDVAQE